MGYDFYPKNEDAGSFHLGAFSWPVLLEACGYYFSSIHSGGRWYAAWNVDPRMHKGDDFYPQIISNSGFEVTEEEAKVLARIARNFVAIQRGLPDENKDKADLMDKGSITREDLVGSMIDLMHGRGPNSPPWPQKIREDFTDKFADFAEWVEKSGGFKIH